MPRNEPWNPSGDDWDQEADTGQSSERMRLCRLWLRAGDYFSEPELLILLDALEAYRDCPPAARANAVAYLLRCADHDAFHLGVR